MNAPTSAVSRTGASRRALALGLVATLSACASLDAGRDTAKLDQLLTERGAPSLQWDREAPESEAATVRTWLTEPMLVDRAVQLAMLRSPRLQQQYGELGLARADILEATEIANPRLGFSRLGVEDGAGVKTSYGLALPLVDLIVLPSRVRLARLQFEQARFEIASAVLAVSLDVEAAWYVYVGAQQVAQMRAAVADALQTSADLSQRYFDAGNISELQLNRELAAATTAKIDAARAEVYARLAKLELNTLIGLRGPEAEWETAAVLPLPVTAEDDPALLRTMADTSNLNLLAARQGVTINAAAAGTTRAFRLLGDTNIGYEREDETDGSRISGPSLDLELPIFNQGGARVARADAELSLARARLATLELQSGNGIDLAAERVRVLSEIVSIYREALIPQRETVVARSQEEQNFMLIGIFDVIQAKTQEHDAYQGYLEAIRDYWLARVDLMRLVGARLPSEAQAGATTPSVAEILAPSASAAGMAGMDHSAHQATEPAPDSPEPEPAIDHSQHPGGRP
jgi:outer membrane protein, heavy metal efflux system